MAKNKKIWQFPENTNPVGTDLLLIDSNFHTKYITLNTLASFITTGNTGPNTYVTGFTYDNGSLTLSQNDGLNDLTVYIPDSYVTGFTYDGGSLTLSQNDGVSDLTVNLPQYKNYWVIESGVTITIPKNEQKFIYGDMLIKGAVNIEDSGKLVVVNGNIYVSGGTISNSGTTSLIDLQVSNNQANNCLFLTSADSPFTGSTKNLSVFANADIYSNIFFYLPDVFLMKGVKVTIIKTDNNYENTIVIYGPFPNGNTQYNLNSYGQNVTVLSDGTTWWPLN